MNPELQKQISSLETKTNLTLTIGILLGLAWFIDRHLFFLGLETLSLFSFAIFCIISGSRKIIHALYSEVKSNVWNAQRFSQLSPFSLLIGKLIGPALHSWVVGSVCLGVYLWQVKDNSDGLETVCMAILITFLCHALALTYALLQVQQNRIRRKDASILFYPLVILFVLPHITEIFLPAVAETKELLKQCLWYGRDYNTYNFLIISLLGGVTFAFLAAYRMLCAELRIKRAPLLWLFFIITIGVYISGFFTGTSLADASRNILSCSALVACLLSYVTGVMLKVPNDNFSILKKSLSSKNWREFAEESPLWLLSISTGTIFGLINTLIGIDPIFKNELITNLGVASLTIAIITLRDLIFLNYLRLFLQNRASEFYFIILLGTINILLPNLDLPTGGMKIIFSDTAIILAVNLILAICVFKLSLKIHQKILVATTQQVVQKS
jgi:hypothetical protein